MSKETSSHQKGIDRRSFINLLVLGTPGAVTACRAELTGALSINVKPDNETPADVSVLETEKPPECEEWTCQVNLPEIDFDKDSAPWTSEKVRKYFLPEITDQGKIQRFYKVFDELKESLLSKIAETNNFREQKRLTFEFLTSLRTALGDDDKKETSNTEWPSDFNHYLIPHGFYLDIRNEEDNPGNVYRCVLYKTETAKSLTISDDKQNSELPVMTVVKYQNLLSKSNIIHSDLSDFDALYMKKGHFILVNKEAFNDASEAQVFINKMEEINNVFQEHKDYDKDSERIADKLKRQLILHEGMHAFFAQNIDEESISPEEIRKKGIIDMGNCKIDTSKIPDDLLNFQSFTELTAIGYQLMNSEDTAPLIAASHLISFGSPTSYRLAGYVLRHLVWSSPYITDDFKKEYDEYKFNEFATCFRAGLIIPNDELHRMGELMAKLGIYLTQN